MNHSRRTLAVGGAGLVLMLGSIMGSTPAGASSSTADNDYTAARSSAFQSPSGNIRCVGETGGGQYYLRCNISDYDWSYSEGCNGRAFRMTGYSDVSCVSAGIRSGSTLRYGRSWYFGPFKCTSRTSGITCTNGAGHGWMLRKAYYQVS
jgi:hypothetical protein